MNTLSCELVLICVGSRYDRYGWESPRRVDGDAASLGGIETCARKGNCFCSASVGVVTPRHSATITDQSHADKSFSSKFIGEKRTRLWTGCSLRGIARELTRVDRNEKPCHQSVYQMNYCSIPPSGLPGAGGMGAVYELVDRPRERVCPQRFLKAATTLSALQKDHTESPRLVRRQPCEGPVRVSCGARGRTAGQKDQSWRPSVVGRNRVGWEQTVNMVHRSSQAPVYAEGTVSDLSAFEVRVGRERSPGGRPGRCFGTR